MCLDKKAKAALQGLGGEKLQITPVTGTARPDFVEPNAFLRRY